MKYHAVQESRAGHPSATHSERAALHAPTLPPFGTRNRLPSPGTAATIPVRSRAKSGSLIIDGSVEPRRGWSLSRRQPFEASGVALVTGSDSIALPLTVRLF